MHKVIIFFFALTFISLGQAQIETTDKYKFTHDKEIACTSVKSQDRTGTCWSFSATSFLESELIRTGQGEHDLSEMFIVRNIYLDKAQNYLLRQGKANFSQGSLGHDVLRAYKAHGLMPESAYSGKLEGEKIYNHSELAAALKGMLDGILTQKRLSNHWRNAVSAILDVYMGPLNEEFSIDEEKYDIESYTASFKLDPDDYVSITSYSHHPFYAPFILEIPDNYSNGSFYNLPINEFQAVVDKAINNGYTIEWDGDVSEKSFFRKEGIAVIAGIEDLERAKSNPVEERAITQEDRQLSFESYATTDDHLMHITGKAHDQNGNKYYIVKNSWGTKHAYDGFLYMSEAYFRLKTVSVMLHKDGIPSKLKTKIGL